MMELPACVKKRARIKKISRGLLSRWTGEITCNARDHRRRTSTGGNARGPQGRANNRPTTPSLRHRRFL